MDGDALDLEFLFATAKSCAESLKHDPCLSSPIEAGKRGSGLQEHLADLVASVDLRLQSRPDDGDPVYVRAAYARSMRHAIAVLRNAQEALSWLASTHNPSINLGGLYVAERYARLLVGDGSDVVAVPSSEYMYSTVTRPFQPVIDNTPGFASSGNPFPVILHYPRREFDSVLSHPIFAHELGHAAVKKHMLIGQIEARFTSNPKFAEELNQVANVSRIHANRLQRVLTIRAVVRKWVEEVCCDLLAARVAGPSFLFAFAAFIMPLSYSSPGPTHPPNSLRVLELKRQCVRSGWLPYLKVFFPRTLEWVDSIASNISNPLNPEFAFARKWVQAEAEFIHEIVEKTIPDGAMTPGEFERDAREAAGLLAESILPVGLSEPLRSRAILLGGWHYALSRGEEGPVGLVKAMGDSELQRMVGKAIEMSVVARSWRVAA